MSKHAPRRIAKATSSHKLWFRGVAEILRGALLQGTGRKYYDCGLAKLWPGWGGRFRFNVSLSRRFALTLRGMLFSRNDANVYSWPRLPTTSLGNSIKSKSSVLQEGPQEPTTAAEPNIKAKAKAKAATKAKAVAATKAEAVAATPEPSAVATDALGGPTPDKLVSAENRRRCDGKQPHEAPKTAALACPPPPNGASASSQPPTEKARAAPDE